MCRWALKYIYVYIHLVHINHAVSQTACAYTQASRIPVYAHSLSFSSCASTQSKTFGVYRDVEKKAWNVIQLDALHASAHHHPKC